MELLAVLVADIHAQKPDHITCTGDTCNIGLPDEWETSRVFLEGLGDPVPRHLRAGQSRCLCARLARGPPARRSRPGPGATTAARAVFPYLRRYGPHRHHRPVLGHPDPSLRGVAAGSGRSRRKAVEADPRRSRARSGLLPDRPHPSPAACRRGGAGPQSHRCRRFEKMIGRVGAELVLHGHNHVGSLAHLDGPRGPMPVIGAPSASARERHADPQGRLSSLHHRPGRDRLPAEGGTAGPEAGRNGGRHGHALARPHSPANRQALTM